MVAMARLEVQRAVNGEYFWRFKTANNRQVSWSGETYPAIANAFKGALAGSPVAEIDRENDTIWCYNDGELVEGKLIVSEPHHNDAGELEISPDVATDLTNEDLAAVGRGFLNSGAAAVMQQNFRLDPETSHWLVGPAGYSYVLHMQADGETVCNIEGCNVTFSEGK